MFQDHFNIQSNQHHISINIYKILYYIIFGFQMTRKLFFCHFAMINQAYFLQNFFLIHTIYKTSCGVIMYLFKILKVTTSSYF